MNLKLKMKILEFLRSSLSGSMLNGSRSEQNSFGKYLKRFNEGKLENLQGRRRCRKRSYVDVEGKLVQYLKLRQEKYKLDKIGTSWLLLKEKCLQWAQDLELQDFKCSCGWLNNTLKLHGFAQLNLHGEADNLSDEEVSVLMVPWRIELANLLEEKDVAPTCVYNIDQTGFFYQKLLNSMYMQENNKKFQRDKTDEEQSPCDCNDMYCC